ncbi:MAG: protein kinase [Myxococcales bacterium]|nr:protein kinase [Myxococcales bacterium]
MAQQRYSIIEKLDAGGMAEVFKGKAISMRGFEKLVAIKRVLPSLSKNEKFLGMFLDEARLSLHLNHANIVQTFDIGRSKQTFFIVMEWVDGVNLKGVMSAATQRGFRLPVEQAIYIAIEVCKGLSHAHNRRDAEDRPLNIVHRDISPPNVLMSREGEVKLVDFGLAKAANQVSVTDPGVVKGKFSYLSPEAAYGKPVDGRADIFATGIVLWEMLAGRPLFDGETDLKTVELVRAAKVPPLNQFNGDVTPELEQIVQKALARDPRERFQNAEALGHELSRHLFENRLMVTSFDIAMLVKRVLSLKETRHEPVTSGVARLEAEVQAEIGAFASLEDLEKQVFRPVSEHEDPDRTVITSAEDPRDWAAELGLASDEDTFLQLPPPRTPSGEAPPAPDRAETRPLPVRQVRIPRPDTGQLPELPNDRRAGPGLSVDAGTDPTQSTEADPPPRSGAGDDAPNDTARIVKIVGATVGAMGAAAAALWYFLLR